MDRQKAADSRRKLTKKRHTPIKKDLSATALLAGTSPSRAAPVASLPSLPEIRSPFTFPHAPDSSSASKSSSTAPTNAVSSSSSSSRRVMSSTSRAAAPSARAKPPAANNLSSSVTEAKSNTSNEQQFYGIFQKQKKDSNRARRPLNFLGGAGAGLPRKRAPRGSKASAKSKLGKLRAEHNVRCWNSIRIWSGSFVFVFSCPFH